MSQKSCGMIQGLLRFKDRPGSIGTPLSCFMPVTASGLTMPCLPANLVGPAQAAVEIAEQTFFDAGSRDCRRYAPASRAGIYAAFEDRWEAEVRETAPKLHSAAG